MANTREKNEEDLVRRAADGDHGAFAALVERYQRPLINFAYRCLGHREDAEDVAQDAFVRTYFSLPRLEDPARFASYLFAIALNLCRRRMQEREPVGAGLRPRPYADSATGEFTWTGEGACPTDLAAESLQREEHERIVEAIAALPEEYREVICLRVEDGLTFAEIGEILGASEGACRVRYHRARQMLRAALRAPAVQSEDGNDAK